MASSIELFADNFILKQWNRVRTTKKDIIEDLKAIKKFNKAKITSKYIAFSKHIIIEGIDFGIYDCLIKNSYDVFPTRIFSRNEILHPHEGVLHYYCDGQSYEIFKYGHILQYFDEINNSMQNYNKYGTWTYPKYLSIEEIYSESIKYKNTFKRCERCNRILFEDKCDHIDYWKDQCI